MDTEASDVVGVLAALPALERCNFGLSFHPRDDSKEPPPQLLPLVPRNTVLPHLADVCTDFADTDLLWLRLPSLSRLVLGPAANFFVPALLTLLAHSPRLTELSLNNMVESDEDVLLLLKTAPGLSVLTLIDGYLGPVTLARLAEQQGESKKQLLAPALRELRLDACLEGRRDSRSGVRDPAGAHPHAARARGAVQQPSRAPGPPHAGQGHLRLRAAVCVLRPGRDCGRRA
jgi:hypothetical protein